MVEIVEKDGNTYYICDICGLAYEEQVWAQKCEQACACST